MKKEINERGETMRNTLEKKNGITLIALVITIIVLLILAGVTIAMITGENGLMERTTEARIATVLGEAKDGCALKVAEAKTDAMQDYYVNGSTDTLETLTLNKVETALKSFGGSVKGVTISDISKGEDKVTFKLTYDETTENGTVTKEGALNWAGSSEGSGSGGSSATLPAGTYTAGQEVTFGGEQFFVVADDGDSVRLLAKYCLSKTENTQLTKDATEMDYGRPFSSTNYWSSDFTSGPLDLQSEAMLTKLAGQSDENAENNAIIKAQEYGKAKGVKGRLMTYEEADAIVNGSDETMKKILFGTWTDGTQPSLGFLYMWLGVAESTENIKYVNGSNRFLSGISFSHFYTGVRPVLVVSES